MLTYLEHGIYTGWRGGEGHASTVFPHSPTCPTNVHRETCTNVFLVLFLAHDPKITTLRHTLQVRRIS